MSNVINKQIINAFKNGIVPDNSLNYVLTGRKKELAELRRCLDNTGEGISTIKFISGKYGSGKTFLASVFKEMALDSGYIVAKLQIDRGFRFNNLEHLYYNIMHNLFINNSYDHKTSFDDIFDIWIDNLQTNPNKNHSHGEIKTVIDEISKYNGAFATGFLGYIRAKITGDTEQVNGIVSWLSGEKNISHQVKEKLGLKGDVNKVNSIDFLKAFIRLVTLLKYKGLVIIIDEMDLIVNERSDIRLNSYTNLRYLIDITASGELENTMFLFSGSDELFNNEEKGVKTYEALDQRLGNAISKQRDSLLDYRQPILFLTPLVFDDYLVLSERIFELYKSVFPMALSISIESLKNWVFFTFKKDGIRHDKVTLRQFITKLIEILDIMEQNPKTNIFKTELTASFNGKELILKNHFKRASNQQSS